jgi:hypothetical protein
MRTSTEAVRIFLSKARIIVRLLQRILIIVQTLTKGNSYTTYAHLGELFLTCIGETKKPKMGYTIQVDIPPHIMKLLLLILLFAPLAVLAQEEADEKLSHHAIGLSASMLSGPGISYQYIFNDDHRLKLTAFGYYEKTGSGSSDLTMIVGGEYQYTAASSRSTRFYIQLGGYYWNEKNVYQSASYPDYTTYSSTNQYKTFAAGAGIGFEVAVERHFLISIDGSLLFRRSKRTYPSELSYSYNGTPTEYFGPGIGFAVYYRF